MIENLRLERLLESVKSKYENGDPGHDFAHINRVISTARRIGLELGADLDILLPAAALHDIVNLPKDHPERSCASRMAAAESADTLKNLDYTQEQIQKICGVIEEHSFSRGLKPTSLESSIMQDADRLDALGAVGIMRTVTCGCRMGANYYDVTDLFARDRALDDKKFTVDHFFVKLFKLPENFNTRPAQEEGRRRVEFMKAFLAQLEKEI